MSDPVGQARWALAAMSLVLGLVVLDETVVGVALPRIQAELGFTPTAAHWVVNAYLLTFTCFVALAGRVADLVGRGPSFLAGLALFAGGSLAAALAADGTMLIAARALQGCGAAILFPAGFAVLTAIFPPDRRGAALGLQTTVGGLFMASGPLLGGALAEHLSWRWIFWLNLPLLAAILAAFLVAWPLVAATGPKPAGGGGQGAGPRIDWPGLALLLAGLTALTLGLMESGSWGWGSLPVLLLLAAGAASLAAFLWLEVRRRQPLLHVDLLRIPTFAGGVIVFFMFQFDKITVFIFVPLYLQQVLGLSPVDAGLPILAAVLPSLVTSLLAGRAADRLGSRLPATIGLAANGVALLLVGLATALDSLPLIVAALLLWGAVLPVIAVPSRRALMSAVPPDHQGQASGVNLTVQMMGGTLGLALCTSILAATGSFPPVFLLTGLLVLACLGAVWGMMERPGRRASDATERRQ
ncbi:MFS transporter [Marinibaculum pumilum]|uniref:MFS transporter n=1 Tax=Marinibaculum pumilum TaxID=1766165 RepID=A0ABV7L515_9PROT